LSSSHFFNTHSTNLAICSADRPTSLLTFFLSFFFRLTEWEEELEAYAASHPEVCIHDMPQDTYSLRNRGTMLVPLQAPGKLFSPPTQNDLPIRCCAPTHTTIEANTPFLAAKTQLIEAGITYPMLAKSLYADGSPSSHALAVINSDAGLLRITQGELQSDGLVLPLLFEQYIDHGTCLFKVYVLGDHIEVMVTRPSLNLPSPSISDEKKELLDTLEKEEEEGEECGIDDAGLVGTSPPVPQLEELESFTIPPPDVEVVSRVSSYPRCRSWGKGDLAPRGHGVPPPPEWLWRGIAAKIRAAFGLSLFNFDLIVPLAPAEHQRGLVDPKSTTAVEGLVHLIDINYFPGIEKLPNYEALLVQFFNDLRDKRRSSLSEKK
jgi:inositol-1,3,4-trisphosphate 5/6-kinase/inositol-tetrakisphosphate 1-kinase